ncbi:hypothetical protein Tco_1070211 [Tanacetum coccineum]|uniref:Uncharacterized protein n=1 Tax=Tanacetum coccineum TaxID=301880 RepID=A0ABQ5HL33_9ASTR
METKNTSSSGSDLEEPEIQKLQMQAKNLKENSLNKLNALKTTIQHLLSSKHSMSVLSRNMQNLEMQFSNETLHKKDSNSELRVIKGQFEHFIHSMMFELSKYNTIAREILQDFNAYTTMEAQPFKETIIQNMDSIAQCMVERSSHEQELKMTLKRLNESQKKRLIKIQKVLPAESSSTDTPLEQVQNNDENNVFANERQHSEKNSAECTDERAALANLIANLTLDTEENKTILKQLKKANASLTQELKECRTNLDETGRALGEATSCRDSCLIALQNKQNEFEKYKAFNDRTIDYEILQTKLNETLGLLALKDIEIKEGLKTKAYEISVLNQKHDELVKKSLLTKSQLEGYLKENTKVISDLKINSYIHMFAPKCSTYNGRPTFANPRYLKKAQSEKPCLYEIPYDTSDLANRFAPNREETMTLANESRSKLNKDYVKPYDYTKQNSLYEIFKAPSLEYLYQLERTKEVRKTMWRKPFVRTKPNIAKNVAFLPVSKSISKITQQNLSQVRKQAVRNTNVIAPGPSRNNPKHVSFLSPKEFVGSNDMVHNYYLEKAKKSAQLQKDKDVKETLV